MSIKLNGTNGIVIPTLSSPPISPEQGQMYYNTTDNKSYMYDNSEWKVLINDDTSTSPWRHIESRSFSSDTATPIYFNDVFNNNEYISYKVYIHHWMSTTDGDELYIRMLNGTDSQYTGSLHYTSIHHTNHIGDHMTTNYSASTEGRLWEENWISAYGGTSGEITIDNVSTTTVGGVNLDRGTNSYRPNVYSTLVGYYNGNATGGGGYVRADSYTRFNDGKDASYWKGFCLYHSNNNAVKAGSSLSIYGLRPPR